MPCGRARRREAATLSLGGFITEMARLRPAGPTQDALAGLIHDLVLSHELIEGHVCFQQDAYARNLVCRAASFELLVLSWRPGQQTTIHDHDGALNAIRVHRGRLTSRLYTRGGEAGARLLGEQELAPGALTSVGEDEAHQLLNLSDRDLVTVHVYAPPLRDIVVYSTDGPGSERVHLRYSLGEDIE